MIETNVHLLGHLVVQLHPTIPHLPFIGWHILATGSKECKERKKRKERKEREKVAQELQELLAADPDFDLDFLGPSKKQRKSLKTPIEKLKNYNLIVGDSVFWASRQVYLKVVQSFLSRKIDGETLTSKFFQLRTQDMMSTKELCAIIEDQIPPIPDLYYTFRATDFSSTIDELYLEIDRYDPDIDDWDWNNIVYSESELRSVIQENFVPRFQKYCDLNDSFFRPQVDLDQLIRRSYLIFIMSSLGLFISSIA